MVFAALKSDLITAYVDAVIVPSNPERKTLQKMACFGQPENWKTMGGIPV
jgi:hypothetical protein